jgi:hypothetical protein
MKDTQIEQTAKAAENPTFKLQADVVSRDMNMIQESAAPGC